jgi:hypothetical protein
MEALKERKEEHCVTQLVVNGTKLLISMVKRARVQFMYDAAALA